MSALGFIESVYNFEHYSLSVFFSFFSRLCDILNKKVHSILKHIFRKCMLISEQIAAAEGGTAVDGNLKKIICCCKINYMVHGVMHAAESKMHLKRKEETLRR